MRSGSWNNSALIGLWMAAGLISAAETVSAQPPAARDGTSPDAAETAEELTIELLDARLVEVREAEELGEATKTQTVTLYQQARQELERADEWARRAVRFQQSLESLPERLERTRDALAALPAEPPREPVREPLPAEDELQPALQRLERQLAEIEHALNAPDEGLRARSLELEAEPARRQARSREIPGELRAAQERAAAADERLQAPRLPDDPAEVWAARRALWQAQAKAADREIVALRQELALYEAEEAVNLLRLRRDLLARQTALAQQEFDDLRGAVDRLRREEAERRVREARLEAAGADERLRPVAEKIEELAREHELGTRDIQKTESRLRETNRQFYEVQTQFRRAREMVESVGLTDAVGLLLRNHRLGLPDPGDYRYQINARRETIRQVQFRLFQLDDERSALADLDGALREILDDRDHHADEELRQDPERKARELLERKREQLDLLIGSQHRYFRALVDLDNAQQQLIDQVFAYADFIDERVFWIRATQPFDRTDVDHARNALRWLFGSVQWREAGRSLWADVERNPALPLAAAGLLAMLLYYRRRSRRALAEAGAAAERSACREFRPTAEALAHTILLSVPGPAVVWYVGWRLGQSPGPTEFTGALSAGLVLTAAIFLPLELLRRACASQGLLAAHFGMSVSAVALLRRHLRWLELVAVPLTLIGATAQSQSEHAWQNSLGRLCFVAGLIAVAVFLQRVVRALGSAWPRQSVSRLGASLERSRFAWSLAAVGMQLALAGLAAWGYYYTSQKLAWRLHTTMWLLVGLWFVHALVLRWVLVRRRNFAMQEARERRAAAREKASQTEEAAEDVIPAVEEPVVDWNSLGDQAQRLVRSGLVAVVLLGLWLIWSNLLPALRLLDQPLWRVDNQQVATLGNVALAVLIGVFAFIAARNIPGLLEFGVLQRLPFDSGLRYAITSLVSYLIVILGIVFAFGALGIGWSKVQWLVAAVSVGLGFGLQEIFANFVSGLILLFERPIRVGDVITIDGVDGRVTQIRMRATTIMNWERKELIVPNKDLITGRLLNWTLTSETLRVPISVGVAYGSDTRRVRELLQQIAHDQPHVLDDPAPFATFEEFGDSTLNFVLRIFLPNLDNLWTVLDDINCSIHDRFAEEGIEIAFPQRDLHLRSVSESVSERVPGLTGNGARRLPAEQR